MKVLFVVTQTANKSNGGVESLTQLLTNSGLAGTTIISNRTTERSERWRAMGHSVINLSFPTSNPLRLLYNNFKITRILSGGEYHCIHINDIYGFISFAFGAALLRTPIIFNVRDVKYKERYGVHWQVAALLSRKIVALSGEMQAWLRKSIRALDLLGGGKTAYSYSLVNFSRMTPKSPSEQTELRKKVTLRGDKFIVVVVAAVMAKKRQLDLLETLPLDWLNRDDWELHFIGDFNPVDNPYAESCQKVSEARNLAGKVHFAGFSSTVEDWYKAADCVLIPSQREGLARCMIESIACGTPVLSMDVCSAKEILLRHNCGRVVDHDDWQVFWRELSFIRDTPAWRATAGQNDAASARKLFDPQVIRASYMNYWTPAEPTRPVI